MDQALNSQKTPHTSPLRASYGMSFVSILMKNDRVIKGFYCILHHVNTNATDNLVTQGPRASAAGILTQKAHNNQSPTYTINRGQTNH